jgi:hypothetical protein
MGSKTDLERLTYEQTIFLVLKHVSMWEHSNHATSVVVAVKVAAVSQRKAGA